MTEATDAIKASITHEWQTTRQIVESCGVQGNRRYLMNVAYRILKSDHNFGLVERRILPGRGFRQIEWRLPEW